MRKRLNILDRVSMMSECRNRIFELHEYLWELLTEKLAPYDERNYGQFCGLNEEARPYDDIDTPLVGRIYATIDKAYDEMTARCKELDAEEDAYNEASLMFMAWNLGLCPYVMREYRRELRYVGEAGDTWEWADIARYLDGKGMSRTGTINAVNKWHEVKDMKIAM